jgi:hypothetical protein
MRQQSKQPDGGPVSPVKGLQSQGIYSRGELDNSYKPNQTRAKGSLPEKQLTANEKELLSLSRGDVEEGSC